MHKNFVILWSVLADFSKSSSWRAPVIFFLMLAQSVTAGIGLLFIIPLLQLIGFDTGVRSDATILNFANTLFDVVGVPITLPAVLISYVALVTLIASMRSGLTVISAAAQQRYICQLRNSLYRSVLHSNWQFILSRALPGIIHTLTIQVQTIGHATHLLLKLASTLILTGVLIILAFASSWQMSLLALIFGGLLAISLLPLNRRIYGSGVNELTQYKDIFQMLAEQLGSLKMIKSFASETYHADRVQYTSEALEQSCIRFTGMNAFTQWIYMIAAVIGFSAFFYIAQTQFSVPLPTTLLLLIIFSRLLPSISELQQNYQQVLHKIPAFNDVNQLRILCKQYAEEPAGKDINPPVLRKRIRIEAMDYAYPKRDPLFKNFSATIERNQTVALVGPSGAGKSTLADLIAGLLAPQSGTIYCDDTPLTGGNRLAWRETVAYVTQEVFLFNDSVRANLAWVADNPNDDELWSALSLAAADGFVSRLPRGLDTVIGDRGVRLSGGERQRLVLARAIVRKPQVLILDEATSALDNDNETLIHEALQRLHGTLTIVIIAHRETTIRHADAKIILPQTSSPLASHTTL